MDNYKTGHESDGDYMNTMLGRAHRRYALHLPVELRSDSVSKANGLLIEISQEHARISQLERDTYQPGDPVTVRTPCGMKRQGHIRWTRATIAGVRFEEALHIHELADWLSTRHENHEAADLHYAS